MKSLQEIRQLLKRITMTVFGKDFKIRCEVDNKFDAGRIFLQVVYNDHCRKTNEYKEWHGRKFYLSDHMTDDEIVKTSYVAFEAAVKHELMEGFKVDGTVLFNPHVDFEELLKISYKEVSRKLTAGEEVKK